MLINDYNLKKFKENFNNKKRTNATPQEKFKTIKKELIEWCQFDSNENLRVFRDLSFYIEGYSLVMEFRETTNTQMKIRFTWNLSEITPLEVQNYVTHFCKEILNVKEPRLTITEQFMYENLGLYYPEDENLVISLHLIYQLKREIVLAILRHELIHHYCSVNGLGARDVDNDFISLIIKYDAYVSMAPNAQYAYKKFVANLVKNGSGFASEEFSEDRMEVLYKKWLLKTRIDEDTYGTTPHLYSVF